MESIEVFHRKSNLLELEIENLLKEDTVIAFSGGVDSCLLLRMACEAAKKTRKRVYALTFQTKLHPTGEIKEATDLAKEMGAESIVIQVDELESAGIVENPVDRCYRCKKYMFQKAFEMAESHGILQVLDGTNLDDTKEYRPGLRALEELSVISPLKEQEFTKQEVRMLSERYGIRTAKKPSNPCMATRFPYDTKLEYEELLKAERAENYIRSWGYYNVRARIHGNLVRIEVDEKDLLKIMEDRKEIVSFLKQLGYAYVSIDLEGFRSGSQDENIVTIQSQANLRMGF